MTLAQYAQWGVAPLSRARAKAGTTQKSGFDSACTLGKLVVRLASFAVYSGL